MSPLSNPPHSAFRPNLVDKLKSGMRTTPDLDTRIHHGTPAMLFGATGKASDLDDLDQI